MNYILTHHARLQLFERMIAESDVAETITNPDQVVWENDRRIFQKQFDSYLLRVITILDRTHVRVLTVYRTSKLSKYV